MIRHGETDYNRRRMMQGHSEQPLNDLGIQQAARLARRLGDFPIERIYSSDIRRAVMTSAIIAARLDRPILYEPLLRERDPGELTHQPYERTMEFFTDPDFNPPGGETQAVFDARVAAAFARLAELERLAKFKSGRGSHVSHVAVVTHGMVCSSFHKSVVADAGAETPAPFAWGNASLTMADYADGRWVVAQLGDTGHLDDLGAAPLGGSAEFIAGRGESRAAVVAPDAASRVGG